MTEHIDLNCHGEADAFVDLTNSLRVPHSRNTDIFCIRTIEKLSELVNRFIALQPSDINFERYLSAILTHSKAFLMFFDAQLTASSNVDSSDGDVNGQETSNGFFSSFMEAVYRPFFDKLSQCIDMQKAGVNAVKLFEGISRLKFFDEDGMTFCDAATQAEDRYVMALAEQIKLHCSQLFRSVYEVKANIDFLTNVYSRRRTFELLQIIFDEYFDNDDIANVNDGDCDDNCGDDCDDECEVDAHMVDGTDCDDNILLSDSTDYHIDCEAPSEPVKSKSLAVVFIDLDRFKRVNDDFDHNLGDKVLGIVGRVLKECVRINDVVGRFGGEEFVLVLDDVTLEDVISTCDRLKESIDKAVRAECPDLVDRGLTASIGIAVLGINSNVKTASALVNAGDVAAYGVKKNGRNGIVYIKDGRLYKVTNVIRKDKRLGGGCSFDEHEITVPTEDGSAIEDTCVITFIDDDVEFTVKIEDRKIVSVSTRDISRVQPSVDVGDDGLIL